MSARRLKKLQVGGRLMLFVLVVMPAFLLVLVINNWQATQESMSRESVITVTRSRIDAAKFVQQLHRARAEDGANVAEMMLRLDILFSRQSIIERVPDVRLGETTIQHDADRVLSLITEIDGLIADTGRPLRVRLDAAALLAEELDPLFQRIETYALSESNARIALNLVRSEQLLWLTVLLSLGTMAAATIIWRYRRRDTLLLREQNAALDRERRQSDYNALHDELTGLPNRRYFGRMLRALAPAESRHGGIVLLHIDLDRFKEINDTRGHGAGDAVLSAVGRRLTGLLDAGEFGARIGGDEFIVILPGGMSRESIARRADAIGAAIARPIPYQDSVSRISASIGIAVQGTETFDPETLMIAADTALYRAKKDGRARNAFFTDELLVCASLDRALVEDLRRAVAAREFIPVYQPQYDARTRELVGAEALARWSHPERGLLQPAAFIRTAEEAGMMAAIDDLILEQALADRATAHRDGLCLPRLSVNVSAGRLVEPGLIERLETLQIPRDSMAFELVETVLLDEADETMKANLQRIRAMGIGIEIDDFGTGHASISGLLALAPDRIKIDRLFVNGIESSAEMRTLLASVIAIGKSRRIEIAAEGVETEEQALILARLGCDILQGYALGRPMGFPAFKRQLAPLRDPAAYAAS